LKLGLTLRQPPGSHALPSGNFHDPGQFAINTFKPPFNYMYGSLDMRVAKMAVRR
jgi:hypothetical protein